MIVYSDSFVCVYYYKWTCDEHFCVNFIWIFTLLWLCVYEVELWYIGMYIKETWYILRDYSPASVLAFPPAVCDSDRFTIPLTLID